jgi:hypothetical protein
MTCVNGAGEKPGRWADDAQDVKTPVMPTLFKETPRSIGQKERVTAGLLAFGSSPETHLPSRKNPVA